MSHALFRTLGAHPGRGKCFFFVFSIIVHVKLKTELLLKTDISTDEFLLISLLL